MMMINGRMVKTGDEIMSEQEDHPSSINDSRDRAREWKERSREWERRRRTTYKWAGDKNHRGILLLVPVGLNEDGTTYDLE